MCWIIGMPRSSKTCEETPSGVHEPIIPQVYHTRIFAARHFSLLGVSAETEFPHGTWSTDLPLKMQLLATYDVQ